MTLCTRTRIRTRIRTSLVAAAAALTGAAVVAVPTAVSAAPGTRTVSGSGSASCPSGYVVAGGGFTLPSDSYSSYSSTAYAIRSSGPTSATRWAATASVVRGSYSSSSGWRYTTSSYAPQVKAVCVA